MPDHLQNASFGPDIAKWSRDIVDTDAVIIDGPANSENGPVFLGEVTCIGSEVHLSECGNVLSTDNCTRAAISFWKYSRELLHNQQVLYSINYLCATL